MSYDGGKAGAGVYQSIINQIPPHSTYIEPFLGAGAVLRRKRLAVRNVGIELDAKACDAWQRDPVPGVELYHCDGIEWLRHEFGVYRLPVSLISASHPEGGRLPESLNSASLPGAEFSPGPDAQFSGEVLDRPSRIAAASAGGAISGDHAGRDATNGDARGTLDWPAMASVVVYCDPPYPLATRRNGNAMYRCEMTDDDHVKLLTTLKSLPCCVLVSSYWSELYVDELHDWRSLHFQAGTRRGVATEWLWMNYPAPQALHDSRYLGKNKRQRERIKRKVRNWTAGLARLPELERQAILDAIASREIERRAIENCSPGLGR